MTFPLRLMIVLAAQGGIACLTLLGLVVAHNFTVGYALILMFVISLFQAALMIRAFGPLVGSETGLSPAGIACGLFGLLIWSFVHFFNCFVVQEYSLGDGVFFALVEILAYLTINNLLLLGFYSSPIRSHYRTTRQQRAATAQEQANWRRRQETQRATRTNQKRREDAKFACRMIYDRHRTTLTNKFTPEQLQDYFAEFLTDEHDVRQVEDRAERLKELLLELIDGDGGNRRFKSLADVCEFYRQERAAIDTLDLPDDVKDSLRADLAREEARTMREVRQR